MGHPSQEWRSRAAWRDDAAFRAVPHPRGGTPAREDHDTDLELWEVALDGGGKLFVTVECQENTPPPTRTLLARIQRTFRFEAPR